MTIWTVALFLWFFAGGVLAEVVERRWEERVWRGSKPETMIEPGPLFASLVIGIYALTGIVGVGGLATLILQGMPDPPLNWLVLSPSDFCLGFQFSHLAYRIQRRLPGSEEDRR